jgi:hypothetical protein
LHGISQETLIARRGTQCFRVDEVFFDGSLARGGRLNLPPLLASVVVSITDQRKYVPVPQN